MSGTYPTTPEFQAINIKSRHQNVFSETISGRTQVRTWEVSVGSLQLVTTQ